MWSTLLVEETGVPGENHCQTSSHNVASTTACRSGIRTHNFSGDRQIAKVIVNPTTLRSR
jgi:hypothetical protein